MTPKSPEEAQALEHDTGVPTLSLADDIEANMREAVDRADIGHATICAPSSVTVNLLVALLIETMGRDKVLQLPTGRRTDSLGGRVLVGRSAQPFGPGVTLQDIEGRVDAGATVQVLDASPSADDLLLAAVSPDGAVNLQPGSLAPGQDDSVVALVSGDDTTPR